MFINNKAQLKPRSEQPSRNTGSPTGRYCKLANELGTRASGPWCVMHAASCVQSGALPAQTVKQ